MAELISLFCFHCTVYKIVLSLFLIKPTYDHDLARLMELISMNFHLVYDA